MKQERVSVGQSIVFMAILILVLIAFAGLSIDTGNAFARQRTIQAAANSGAVSGMNSVLLANSDSEVAATVQKTMTANGVKVFQRVDVGNPWGTQADTVYYTAEYLNAAGEFDGNVGALASSRPVDRGVSHIRITTSVDVQNTFAKVFGVKTFKVGAKGAAGTGECVNGVYPITFHKLYLEARAINPTWSAPVTMEAVGLTPYAEISAIPALNKPASTLRTPRFRVMRNPSSVGISGNFGWTRWSGGVQNGSQAALAASLTGAGNLGNGFTERTPPANDPAAVPLLNNSLEAGDWIATDTGTVNSSDVVAALNAHKTQKTLMILPVHDIVEGSGNSPDSRYHVIRFAKVRLLNYDLGPNGFFEFALVQDKALCSEQETSPVDGPPPNENPFKMTFKEQLQWVKPPTPGNNYDIAIVQDYSVSMKTCWDTNSSCPVGTRRIDYASKALRAFVNEFLVVRNGSGGENRLAYVTYGQTATQHIGFGMTNAQALTKFKEKIGDTTTPRDIPISELVGNTNTADGLTKAVAYLSGARTVDSQGNEVKLVVLLLTDGLTNVFNDGAHYTTTNRWDRAYNCGDTEADMDNPYIQATCPSAADFPGGNRSKPPIIAMVDAANDARRANPRIVFYAVVLGAQFGLTPESMYLNQVAPDHYYMANSATELQGLVGAIEAELGDACDPRIDGPRLANGATVTIKHQEGEVVGTFTTNANGEIITNLAQGSYIITAQHLNVASPNDPRAIPRNYTRMIASGTSLPSNNVTVTMPNTAFTGPNVTLVIDNPANAQCN